MSNEIIELQVLPLTTEQFAPFGVIIKLDGAEITHHFQIGTGRIHDLIVVDRGGRGDNLEETTLEENVVIPQSVIDRLWLTYAV